MRLAAAPLLAGLLLVAFGARAHDHHGAKPAQPAQAACAEASLACAKSATPAFGPDGRMWIIWSAAGRVYVSASSDRGASFGAPVPVSDPAEVMDDNGEARPALLAAQDGTLVALYAQRVDNRYNGKLFFTRSTDGGQSFAPPRPMLDGVGQRFPVLAQDDRGRIHAAWLDTRNRLAAQAAGRDYRDTGIAMAWSDDSGATFQGRDIRADLACDCCRVAMTLEQGGTPLLAWRHVFGRNLRDHVVARAEDTTAPLSFTRVSEDDWAIDACPRHGPALAAEPSGALDLVWYTAGKRRQGLFFARSTDGGKSFSEPQGFGQPGRKASNPQVLALDGRLWRAWKEFDGTTVAIQAQSSADGGKAWDEPRAVATTAAASDHPLLVAREGRAYLSWLTKAEGYRLLELAP